MIRIFFKKLSKKERTFLVVGIGFVFIAILDNLVISPINYKIKRIEDDIKMSEKQLAETLFYFNHKETIVREYQKYTSNIKKIGSDEQETAKILSLMEDLAHKSAIYLVNVKPQASREIDSYKEYSLAVEVEAEMSSLMDFLYQLSASAQLLHAEKIRLSLKEKDSRIIRASILVTKILVF